MGFATTKTTTKQPTTTTIRKFTCKKPVRNNQPYGLFEIEDKAACFYGIVTADRFKGPIPMDAFDNTITSHHFEESSVGSDFHLTIRSLIYADSEVMKKRFGVLNCIAAREHAYGFVYLLDFPVYAQVEKTHTYVIANSARLFYRCCYWCGDYDGIDINMVLHLRSLYFSFMAMNVYHYVKDIYSNTGEQTYLDVFKIKKETARLLNTDAEQLGCPDSEDGHPVESFIDRGICLYYVHASILFTTGSPTVQWKSKNGLLKEGFSLMIKDMTDFRVKNYSLQLISDVISNVRQRFCTCVNIVNTKSGTTAHYRSYCFYAHNARWCQAKNVGDQKRSKHICVVGRFEAKSASFRLVKDSYSVGEYCVARFREHRAQQSVSVDNPDLSPAASIASVRPDFDEKARYLLNILFDIRNNSFLVVTVDNKTVCPYSNMNGPIKYSYVCGSNLCNLLFKGKFEYDAARGLIKIGVHGFNKEFCIRHVLGTSNFFEGTHYNVKVYDFQQRSFVRIIPGVNAMLLNHFDPKRTLIGKCRFVEAVFIPFQQTCGAKTIPSWDFLPWTLFVCFCGVWPFCPTTPKQVEELADNHTIIDEFYHPACLVFNDSYTIYNIEDLKNEAAVRARTTFVCYVRIKFPSELHITGSILQANHIDVDDVSYEGGMAEREMLETYHFVADSIAFNMRLLGNPHDQCIPDLFLRGNESMIESVTCFCRLPFEEMFIRSLKNLNQRLACNDYYGVVEMAKKSWTLYAELHFMRQQLKKQIRKTNKKEDKRTMLYLRKRFLRCGLTKCYTTMTISCETGKQKMEAFQRESALDTLCYSRDQKTYPPIPKCFFWEEAIHCCLLLEGNLVASEQEYHHLKYTLGEICKKWMPK